MGFVCVGMERSFLSQKGSGGGRGVKEKNPNQDLADPAYQEKSGVAPSVTVASETTLVHKRVDVVVLVESIGAINARFATTTYDFFLGKRMAYSVLLTMLGTLEDARPKNIDSDVVKNMKKPSQAPRDVSLGPKIRTKGAFGSQFDNKGYLATPQIHHYPPPLPPQPQPPPHCHVHNPVTLSTVTIYRVTTSPCCPHHQHHHSRHFPASPPLDPPSKHHRCHHPSTAAVTTSTPQPTVAATTPTATTHMCLAV
nr:hypothetical protein [Tanacetum cinerariifolium]